jgi:hypothetical protein
MAGNVAQHIVGDAWPRSLSDIHRSLRPSGTLTFESRNPAAREWESWVEPRTRGTRQTRYGPLTEWLQVTSVDDGSVTFDAHNVFESTGEHVVVSTTLAFRTEEQLLADLHDAGLRTCTITGGWNGEPVESSSRLLVVTARRDPDQR